MARGLFSTTTTLASDRFFTHSRNPGFDLLETAPELVITRSQYFNRRTSFRSIFLAAIFLKNEVGRCILAQVWARSCISNTTFTPFFLRSRRPTARVSASWQWTISGGVLLRVWMTAFLNLCSPCRTRIPVSRFGAPLGVNPTRCRRIIAPSTISSCGLVSSRSNA